MKRFSFLLLLIALSVPPAARAQDAATEERLKQLSGKLDDCLAGQESMRKQIEDLSREVENLKSAAARPNVNYASVDDVKRVADAIKEVDQNRLKNYEEIRAKLLKLGESLSAPPPERKKPVIDNNNSDETPTGGKSGAPEKGFEYVIQRGDTLDAVVQAYREKNIKITTSQVLKANPGLKPEKLRVGQKIFIPAPQQ